MKQSLIILSLILKMYSVHGQTIIEMPTTREWQTYFYERINAIETKIYYLALAGKIKAYKNDSFKSYYDYTELNKLGAKTLLDSEIQRGNIFMDTLVLEPFHPSEITGILFSKEILSDPFNLEEINQLKGIALLHQMYFNRIKSSISSPLFFIFKSDLISNLTENEFKLITLFYYYSKNPHLIDNYPLPYNFNSEDLLTSSYFHLITDSLFFNKLVYSSKHIENYIQNNFKNENHNIYDYQLKKAISILQFSSKYGDGFTTNHSENNINIINKDYIIDTTIIASAQIQNIHSIGFNKDSILEKFYFEILTKKYLGSIVKEEKLNKFSIDIKDIPTLGPQNPLSWFFEDYFRWKKI